MVPIPVFVIFPILSTVFSVSAGLPATTRLNGGVDRLTDKELGVLSLSLPKLHNWGTGLDSFLPMSAATDRSMNSRLRRAVSMIRLKKDNGFENDNNNNSNEEEVNAEEQGMELDKRAMSMLRLRRANGQKVSLFRLRRTPVSMMRLRRRISQLRLKKDNGNKELDCEWQPERCEEIMRQASLEGLLNGDNNVDESEA